MAVGFECEPFPAAADFSNGNLCSGPPDTETCGNGFSSIQVRACVRIKDYASQRGLENALLAVSSVGFSFFMLADGG